MNQPALLFYSGGKYFEFPIQIGDSRFDLFHFRFGGTDILLGFIDSFLGICRRGERIFIFILPFGDRTSKVGNPRLSGFLVGTKLAERALMFGDRILEEIHLALEAKVLFSQMGNPLPVADDLFSFLSDRLVEFLLLCDRSFGGYELIQERCLSPFVDGKVIGERSQ
ncbi:MAG: hypothetical protein BWY50_02112 [Spirochaetes bacterium ADurb.Bin315]|nr:MAG: hypothetical protein BWY50_02112 [Spirochaetes bacterium ADurb.Bin315]